MDSCEAPSLLRTIALAGWTISPLTSTVSTERVFEELRYKNKNVIDNNVKDYWEMH
jgi:hypothetical protein